MGRHLCRQQVTGPWRWASLHCGPRRLPREPSPQDSGEMGEVPTCLPWHACSSALPSAVCQLCPFPDPTFVEILRSCLNHFLSRPHFQLWGSGPGQQPGAFCTLPTGRYPLSVLSGLGQFLLHRLLTDCLLQSFPCQLPSGSAGDDQVSP